MKFSNNYIIILFLLFLLLLFTFYYFYKFNYIKFIGNLNKYIHIFIYSTIICIIGFCITFYYIYIKNDFEEKITFYIFFPTLRQEFTKHEQRMRFIKISTLSVGSQ